RGGDEPKTQKRISAGDGTGHPLPAAPLCRAMIGGSPSPRARSVPGCQAAWRATTRRQGRRHRSSFREPAPAITAVNRAERLAGHVAVGADALRIEVVLAGVSAQPTDGALAVLQSDGEGLLTGEE